MSVRIRGVRYLGSDTSLSLSSCEWCQVRDDDGNRGNIRVALREPSENRFSERDTRSGRRMIVELSSDSPIRNIEEPDYNENEVFTYLSSENDGSDDMATTQLYELEVDPPADGDWQLSLRTKEKDQEDPEREHRYILISA